MSPVVDKKEINSIIKEIINAKKTFDKKLTMERLKEDRDIPIDYVYRN